MSQAAAERRLGEVGADGSGGTARVVSRGTLLRLRGTGRTESHRVRLRMRRGDYLALQGSAFTAMACAGDAVSQLVFIPPLRPLGALERTADTDACTLLMQATVTASARR